MYTLMRDGLSLQTARLQIPSLVITIVIAESMYKFHSFTLEFLAALTTWTVIDASLSAIARAVGAVRARPRASDRQLP